MLAQERALVTDTTMRDAHQSLLATRMRTHDLCQVADAYAHNLPQLFSLECWGGATFDVALRFLGECPWERLERLRTQVPNILLQMLLRASNGVGYTNYPDNVVEGFVARAAASGIDLFRIFDPLNSVENMRVAIDAVLETGRLCEAAICYTGDLHDPRRSRYDLAYYLAMARELRDAGTHILGIKDMAGLVKPAAARELVHALKEETGLPVHFHTHDTSGIAAASVLAAVDAGVDAVDLAMDSLSGFTSQPCLGSVVEALRGQPRDTGLDPAHVREISDYWEVVRAEYAAFETDMRAPASEVYLHEMPGGQFTNLREQARALGLAERWHEVAEAYAEINRMFGDIVKVTPTSKVVGDMALVMVSGGLTRADVEDPDREIAFPDSVVGLFRGELGRMPGGFPEPLASKILKGEKPIEGRPGAILPPADLEAERARAEEETGWSLSDEDVYSWLFYPKVFADYAARARSVRPGVRLADRRVLLRARAQARHLGRDRARAHAGHPLPGRGRDRRGGRGARLLRAERPAAHRQGREPRGVGERRPPPEGRSGQPVPRLRPDARRRCFGGGRERAFGRGRRPADDDRGDEDGNRPSRRARRHRRGVACGGGTIRRGEGSPARIRRGLSATWRYSLTPFPD